MKKKLISSLTAFSLFLSLTTIPITNINLPISNLSATIAYADDIKLPSNTKDGVILHAFDWSFNSIKNELPNISEAGYKSVQVSPVQGTKESSTDPSKWWLLYQPTNQSIGNAQLGSYNDFKSLCSEADKYGISIIVDVVMNHMASSNDNKDQLDPSVDPSFKNSNYYHNLGQCNNWNGRYDITQLGIGMPDLNTQNPEVQNKAITFLNQCIDAGADGFRFDTAKHIETNIGLDSNQSWSGNYWTNVLSNLHNKSNLFIYGEVLQDGTVDNISSYETFMNVTASNWGYSIRNALKSNNLRSIGTSFNGIDSSKAIDFVETHDTFEDGKSKNLTDDQRKMGWAIAASRANATPLFFDRPTSSIGNEGESLWKDPDIAAINKFHNAMTNQNEYLRWTNNDKTMLIDRGTKGTVIVNSSLDTSINSATNLENGTYTNHGSKNCTLTVSNGTISGTIPANSIIILYGPTSVPDNPNNPTKVTCSPSNPVAGKDVKITYKGSLANSSNVKLHWGYNNWTSPADVNMTKDLDGSWKGTITIPTLATKLDFDFTNGSNWDNNNNQDWHLSVLSNSVNSDPVQVIPNIPASRKNATVYYNGNLASTSTSITLHYSYNSWSSAHDVIMTKQSDGRWSAIIPLTSENHMINMCFKNNSGTWDNNNSSNYSYSISE